MTAHLPGAEAARDRETPLRVVFVDDETRLLDGIRRALRHHEGWDLRFATGGLAAIAEMHGAPADLVVSDMRMPGVDGIALLTIVRERWPATVRVVLSGQADADAGFAAIRIAHQFYDKPCETSVIAGLIERIARLEALQPEARLRALAGGLEGLAPRPSSRVTLERILADRRANPAAVMPVIATDVALAAKVLQVSSTAFLVRTHPFTDLETAIACLGMERLRTIALAQSGAAPGCVDEEWLEDYHAAAVREARAARERASERQGGGLAYLSGLFSNLAPLIAASAGATPPAGPHAAMMGAWLLGAWGLAWPIVEAVAHAAHHRQDPEASPGKEPGGLAA